MSAKKIFWSLLAGLGIALSGCDEDKEPVAYGPPPEDTSVDQPADSDSDEADSEEMSDIIDEENPAILYGPPEYGPTPP
jgi:hypothetical protein